MPSFCWSEWWRYIFSLGVVFRRWLNTAPSTGCHLGTSSTRTSSKISSLIILSTSSCIAFRNYSFVRRSHSVFLTQDVRIDWSCECKKGGSCYLSLPLKFCRDFLVLYLFRNCEVRCLRSIILDILCKCMHGMQSIVSVSYFCCWLAFSSTSTTISESLVVRRISHIWCSQTSWEVRTSICGSCRVVLEERVQFSFKYSVTWLAVPPSSTLSEWTSGIWAKRVLWQRAVNSLFEISRGFKQEDLGCVGTLAMDFSVFFSVVRPIEFLNSVCRKETFWRLEGFTYEWYLRVCRCCLIFLSIL